MVSPNITTWTKPQLSSYFPSDYTTDSSSLPSISEGELEQMLESIKGKIRSVRVIMANLALARSIVAADKGVMAVDAQIEKNQLYAAKMNASVDFERMKLEIDKGGYATMAQLHGQMWQVQIQKKQEAIDKARQQLGGGSPTSQLPQNPQNQAEAFFGNSPQLGAAKQKAQKLRKFLQTVDV